jgi:hypothetical protein
VPVMPTPGPVEAGLGMWLGFGGALLAIAAAGWLARSRSRRGRGGAEEATPLHRLRRLVYSAAAFGSAMTVALSPEYVLREGLSWNYLPLAALAVLVLSLVGMLPFGIVHFWLGLRDPRRDRPWLVRAVLTFVIVMLAGLMLIAAMGGNMWRVLDPALLSILAASAAAGLVWWAWLPPPRANVASRFE